jgi:hypothetical protein
MGRVVTLAFALLAAGCVGVHQNSHVGLHVQGDIGAGGSRSEATDAGVTGRYSGAGAIYSLGLGGAVVPNLIIGGQMWGSTVTDVRFTVEGESQTLTDVTYDVYGFGPMVKFYLMPANVYFSATPSIARLRLSDEFSSDETKWGPALRLAAGKEWYVSRRWGLGVAGALHFASNKSEDDALTWKTLGGGVVFSASYQ